MQRLHQLEVAGEQEQVRHHPGRWVREAGAHKPGCRHQEQCHHSPRQHLRQAREHSHPGITHALDAQPQDVHIQQRNIERRVYLQETKSQFHNLGVLAAVNEQAQHLIAKQQHNTEGQAAVDQPHHGSRPHALPDPVQLPGADVLPGEGRHSGGQGVKHTAEEHAQLEGRAHSRHGVHTQAVHGPLHHHGTDGSDGKLQAHGQTDTQHGASPPHGEAPVFLRKLQDREPLEDHQQAADAGNQLAHSCSHRRAGHVHAGINDQHQVQHDVHQGSQHQEYHRRFAVSQGTENAAGHVIQHAAGNRRENDPDIGSG